MAKWIHEDPAQEAPEASSRYLHSLPMCCFDGAIDILVFDVECLCHRANVVVRQS